MMNARGVQLTRKQLRLLSRVNVVQLLGRRRLKLQCTARGTSTMAIARTLTQMTTARVARRAEQHTRRQPRLVLVPIAVHCNFSLLLTSSCTTFTLDSSLSCFLVSCYHCDIHDHLSPSSLQQP